MSTTIVDENNKQLAFTITPATSGTQFIPQQVKAAAVPHQNYQVIQSTGPARRDKRRLARDHYQARKAKKCPNQDAYGRQHNNDALDLRFDTSQSLIHRGRRAPGSTITMGQGTPNFHMKLIIVFPTLIESVNVFMVSAPEDRPFLKIREWLYQTYGPSLANDIHFCFRNEPETRPWQTMDDIPAKSIKGMRAIDILYLTA